MKLILVGILLIFVSGIMAEPNERFKHLVTERHEEDHGQTFEVWHDTVTGDEIVCGFGGLNVASCYRSGRNWK